MSDYIKYDSITGEIIKKWQSVDGQYLGITTDPCVIEVSREMLLSINEYSTVKDGKVVKMTAEEIAVVDKAKADTIKELEKVPTAVKLAAILIRKGIITKEEMDNEKEPV